MFTKGLKNALCCVIILTAALIVIGIGHVEASRRTLNMNNVMETRMIWSRKVEIGGKIYDICVNQAEKAITIKGLVDEWNEMDNVENYFKHRGPYDYQVICRLDIQY